MQKVNLRIQIETRYPERRGVAMRYSQTSSRLVSAAARCGVAMAGDKRWVILYLYTFPIYLMHRLFETP